MSLDISREQDEEFFDRMAEEYQAKLTLENYMEATPQATQREITVESFALVRRHRPDVHYFNELLVQYPIRGQEAHGQVVPDNMVVVHPGPLEATGHYTLSLQPARPFWVMEYVSLGSRRKDYVRNVHLYERGLRVPYYLRFYPDNHELTLFRHNKRRFVTVLPDDDGLHAVPELDMAVGLVGGWVRFWHQGTMLPLPAELADRADLQERRADDEQKKRKAAERQTKEERRLREASEQREAATAAENARLLAELAKLRGERP